MMLEKMKIDERMRSNARFAAAIWLGVTQVLLAGVVFYRLYIMGQPDSEIRDFQAVLAISLFGYIGLQLYLGGIFPVPTVRGMVVSYLGLVVLITGGCLAIYGIPRADEWASTWLPALLGPALLIGAYYVVAWLGKRRLERRIGE